MMPRLHRKLCYLHFLVFSLYFFQGIQQLHGSLHRWLTHAQLALLPSEGPLPDASARRFKSEPRSQAALRCVRMVVYQRFPVRSSDIVRDTGALENYRQALSTLLAAIVSSGLTQLLRLLHRELRRGRSHIYFANLVGCLRALALSIPRMERVRLQ